MIILVSNELMKKPPLEAAFNKIEINNSFCLLFGNLIYPKTEFKTTNLFRIINQYLGLWSW